MSIKRSLATLLLGAGLTVGGVALSTPATADSLAGASLNRQAADEAPAPADDEDTAGLFGASLN